MQTGRETPTGREPTSREGHGRRSAGRPRGREAWRRPSARPGPAPSGRPGPAAVRAGGAGPSDPAPLGVRSRPGGAGPAFTRGRRRRFTCGYPG
jgi:hypothetical protein